MTAFVRLVPLIVCCVVLAACSGNSKEKAASQVAVKVNGRELSIHQVNAQLSRLQGVPPAQQDAVRKQVVDGLIEQQLLIQQATDKKLDRDPEVLAALEQSRAQILAQAYVQKTLSAQAKPSEEAVKKYYADNPALFAQRRVFRLQELATNLPPERVDEFKPVVASAKALPEVVSWLQKNKYQVAANAAVRGAEQLPLQQVEAVSALKDGEMGVFVSDHKVTVLQVVASQSQPLDEAKASPFIEQFLTSRKRDELARAEVKRLRDSAKIEYVGEFVKLAQLTPTSTPTAAAPMPAPAAAASGSTAVSTGVAGLR
ncbi:MAG: EpsD family peptidyl-prolyl cis-trans isomerase [Rhizobacter sp.]